MHNTIALQAHNAAVVERSTTKLEVYGSNPGGVCCLGMAPRVQLLSKSAWLLSLISGKAPPAARYISEVARV